jgi:hypothetical protein
LFDGTFSLAAGLSSDSSSFMRGADSVCTIWIRRSLCLRMVYISCFWISLDRCESANCWVKDERPGGLVIRVADVARIRADGRYTVRSPRYRSVLLRWRYVGDVYTFEIVCELRAESNSPM